MKGRTVVAIVVIGAALAFVGRYIGRPNATPPAPSTSPARGAPPTGTITVAAFDDGSPARDRIVVFSDEAGGLLATAKTKADGTASGPMTARGMVTIALGTSVRHLVTITAVVPGDRLVFGEEEEDEGTAGVACRIAVTAPSVVANAAKHVVSVGVNDTPLGDPKKPVTVAVLKRFVVGGKVRTLARALDAEGKLLAYSHAFVEGCAQADGGAGSLDVRLPAWSTDLRTFTVEASGGPHGTLEGSITLVPPGADGFALGSREAPIDGEATLVFLAPRPLGTRGRTKLEVKYEDGRDHAEIDERRDDIAETSKIALGERLLPRIRDAVVEGQGSARPSIRWTASSSLAQADAIVARLAWPASREHVWTIVAPPDAPPRLAVPELPDELGAWRPDHRVITPAVGVVDASFWNGYADVKRKGLESLEQPPAADVVIIRSSATGELDL